MSFPTMARRHALITLLVAIIVPLAAAQTANLDPKALIYKLPANVEWKDNHNGLFTSVLQGDPSKEGMYIVLAKWTAHNMSRPHRHPNDRYITVLSGTWWVGTGTKFQPDTTVPLGAGTYVTHFAKEAHYDGAKDADVILQIVGMGPETSTSAETH